MSERALNPFDAWPRLVTNPDQNLVVEHDLVELRQALVRAADQITDLIGLAGRRPLAIEDEGALDILRDLYRFFDNGTWNTPEVEAWCITSPPHFEGWGRSVRAAFATREEAEEFLPEMVAYYASRYPNSRTEELLVERAMARATELKRRPERKARPVLPTPEQVRDLSAPEAVELAREMNEGLSGS